MEGTGLMMGAGRKSGKISRIQKAKKWRDFSNETLRDGIDTAKYGYEQYKSAVNPIGSKFKKMFGGEMNSDSEDEMEGGNIFKKIKKGYNKNVKNTKLGSALRDSAGMAIGDVYDKGAKELDKNKYGKPISQYMKDKKGSNVHKLTGYTGLGLKLSGEGKMKTADQRRYRTADVRPSSRDIEKWFGNGMRLRGGANEACHGSGMQNDKFIFANACL